MWLLFLTFYDLYHQDDELYVYKTGEPHTHLEGYPKPVEEELGIQGPIDAAFVCEDHHIAHVIKGEKRSKLSTLFLHLLLKKNKEEKKKKQS